MQIGTDFPELIVLLKQIEGYRGTGLTAKMFYEGKILEAVSLIMERAKSNQEKKKKLHLTSRIRRTFPQLRLIWITIMPFLFRLRDCVSISFMGADEVKSCL